MLLYRKTSESGNGNYNLIIQIKMKLVTDAGLFEQSMPEINHRSGTLLAHLWDHLSRLH